MITHKSNSKPCSSYEDCTFKCAPYSLQDLTAMATKKGISEGTVSSKDFDELGEMQKDLVLNPE